MTEFADTARYERLYGPLREAALSPEDTEKLLVTSAGKVAVG
jgi:hypothetical protein